VPESAKETCRNWFFKIASIRELIPRFYVECAILRCYSFLTTGEYSGALVRLAAMARGIGDPLVAAYARCYLCRVGVIVAPSIRDHLMPCFDDLLLTLTDQIGTEAVRNALSTQRTSVPHYLLLYAPALDWLLGCLAHSASESLLDTVLERCADMSSGNAVLLNSIMASFRAGFIAARAVELARKIRDMNDVGFPQHVLYCSLGHCVAVADPPEDQKLVLLNEVCSTHCTYRLGRLPPNTLEQVPPPICLPLPFPHPSLPLTSLPFPSLPVPLEVGHPYCG